MSTKWPLKQLGEVVSLDATTARPDELSDRDLYVGLENIASDGSLVGLGQVSAADLKSNKNRFDERSVLFGKLRPYLAKVVRPETSGVCSTDILVLAPSSEIDRNYLYWWLRNPVVIEEATSKCTGATLPRISPTTLASFQIPVPPLDEQQRIVAKLDSVADLASGLSQATETAVSMWDDLYASECRRAFEPRSGWKSVVLPEISENLDGIRRPVTRADRKPGPYPYYGASGVVDHVAGYLFDEELLLVSEDGANLLARSTPIAFTASGQYWVNNHAHVLRFKSPTIHAYVEAYLNSIPIDEWVTGAAQPKLTQGALNRIPIPLPGSDAEIKSVLTSLQDAQRLAAAGRENSGRRMALSRDLQQSVLEAAFRGEL